MPVNFKILPFQPISQQDAYLISFCRLCNRKSRSKPRTSNERPEISPTGWLTRRSIGGANDKVPPRLITINISRMLAWSGHKDPHFIQNDNDDNILTSKVNKQWLEVTKANQIAASQHPIFGLLLDQPLSSRHCSARASLLCRWSSLLESSRSSMSKSDAQIYVAAVFQRGGRRSMTVRGAVRTRTS